MNAEKQSWPRSAGVLLHPTSLPGPAGCGGLGPEAHELVQFLSGAGQTWWQTLPIGPAGKGFSPYSSRSSFAGGTHLISVETLMREGLCDKELVRTTGSSVFDLAAIRLKQKQVRAAAKRLSSEESMSAHEELQAFIQSSLSWLDDWAMFEALAAKQSSYNWTSWPVEIRLRRPDAMQEAKQSLRDELTVIFAEQFLFQKQWAQLRAACERAGVRLMGDVPFYPSLESADVWANQHLFDLDENGQPNAVAGVPPDYFSATGQIWESPMYRWDAHAADGFQWWTSRMSRAAELFDAVRIDHFLGMHRCWRVPHGAATAEGGAWTLSPGRELLQAITSHAPELNIVAEDLGLITPEATALRDEFGFPGMRVLQFAFDSDSGGLHRPDHHLKNSVVYTGTHDNNTTLGWIESLESTEAGRQERDRACEWFGVSPAGLLDAMVNAAYASPSHTAILPMQDVLGLNAKARMNTPGVADGNWRWRLDALAGMDQVRGVLAGRAVTHHRSSAAESQ